MCTDVSARPPLSLCNMFEIPARAADYQQTLPDKKRVCLLMFRLIISLYLDSGRGVGAEVAVLTFYALEAVQP